jgi:hypothetical protein
VSWPAVTDAQSAVQMVMSIGCTLIGLSHVLQPQVWQDYFAELRERGPAGVFTRSITWELWPALILVTLHQVWRGPGVLLTLFGWLLLIKCIVALLLPQIGLRSMAMASRGPWVFVAAGSVLMVIGLTSALALTWR